MQLILEDQDHTKVTSILSDVHNYVKTCIFSYNTSEGLNKLNAEWLFIFNYIYECTEEMPSKNVNIPIP